MKNLAALFLVFLLALLPISGKAQQMDLVPNFLGPNTIPGIEAPDLQRGIKFLTTLDFPPFSFLDSSGRLTGFNVYLAKLVCAELSIVENCTVQAMPWEELGPSIVRGQGDAIISGLAATDASRTEYGFSKPYLRIPARFVGTKSAITVRDFDAGLKGVKIGVLAQSGYERLAQSDFPEAIRTGYASDDLLFSDLASGKIDLIFGDGLRLAFWLSSERSRGCCQFEGGAYYSSRFLGEGMRIAVSAGDINLQKQIDHALISLQRKGKIEELYLRFFPVGFY